MAQRRPYDPLQKVNETRWLVIKDARLSTALSWRALEPNADLRAELTAERLKFIDGGWKVGSLGRHLFCFCQRGHERISIHIQAQHPDHPPGLLR